MMVDLPPIDVSACCNQCSSSSSGPCPACNTILTPGTCRPLRITLTNVADRPIGGGDAVSWEGATGVIDPGGTVDIPITHSWGAADVIHLSIVCLNFDGEDYFAIEGGDSVGGYIAQVMPTPYNCACPKPGVWPFRDPGNVNVTYTSTCTVTYA